MPGFESSTPDSQPACRRTSRSAYYTQIQVLSQGLAGAEFRPRLSAAIPTAPFSQTAGLEC